MASTKCTLDFPFSGSDKATFEDLFTDDFMSKYTNFANLDEMMLNCGHTIETDADFHAIPDDEWEHYIMSNSVFSSWQEMLKQAANHYYLNRS